RNHMSSARVVDHYTRSHYPLHAPLPLQPYRVFFRHAATREIYPLSLHDALPISKLVALLTWISAGLEPPPPLTSHHDCGGGSSPDRKSTRLNSSHSQISYAVFCLKKKNTRARLQQGRATPLPQHARTPDAPRART